MGVQASTVVPFALLGQIQIKFESFSAIHVAPLITCLLLCIIGIISV